MVINADVFKAKTEEKRSQLFFLLKKQPIYHHLNVSFRDTHTQGSGCAFSSFKYICNELSYKDSCGLKRCVQGSDGNQQLTVCCHMTLITTLTNSSG